MTTYFVTRHSGARDWAVQEDLTVDAIVEHLDVEKLQSGDIVIGTLPVNLVADVCSVGGRYLHLVLEQPREMRGRDLSPEDMRACGARLEEYWAERR